MAAEAAVAAETATVSMAAAAPHQSLQELAAPWRRGREHNASSVQGVEVRRKCHVLGRPRTPQLEEPTPYRPDETRKCALRVPAQAG